MNIQQIRIRIFATIFAFALLIGISTHVAFIREYGWFAYSAVEGVNWFFNIYWTLLLFVNVVIIGILLLRPRLGFLVFTIHMALNTLINGVSLLIYPEGLLHGWPQVIRQGMVFCIALVVTGYFYHRKEAGQKS